MLDTASREAETLKKETLVQTREEIHKLREDMEKENKDRRDELAKYEQRLVQKDNNLDQRSSNLEQRESQLDRKENQVKAQKEKVDALYASQQAKLEEISQLSREQAKEMILSRVDEELTHEKAVRIRDAVEEARAVRIPKRERSSRLPFREMRPIPYQRPRFPSWLFRTKR